MLPLTHKKVTSAAMYNNYNLPRERKKWYFKVGIHFLKNVNVYENFFIYKYVYSYLSFYNILVKDKFLPSTHFCHHLILRVKL